jgi:hypothetical protein
LLQTAKEILNEMLRSRTRYANSNAGNRAAELSLPGIGDDCGASIVRLQAQSAVAVQDAARACAINHQAVAFRLLRLQYPQGAIVASSGSGHIHMQPHGVLVGARPLDRFAAGDGALECLGVK